MATNLTNLYISQSFQRLLQVSPDDNKTLLNGTGSNHSNLRISGALEVTDDVRIGGDLYVSGNIWFGDINTDSIAFVGQVSSSIYPKTTNIYDIGSTTKKWRTIYATTFAGTFSGSMVATNIVGKTGKIPKFTGTSSLGVSILHENGSTVVITGSFLPEANGTRNLGSTSRLWSTIYGSVVNFGSSLLFKTGSTEILRIDSNRFIGINQAVPTHYVHMKQITGSLDVFEIEGVSDSNIINVDKNQKIGLGLKHRDYTFTGFNPGLATDLSFGWRRNSVAGLAFYKSNDAAFANILNDGTYGPDTLRFIDGGAGTFMVWNFASHSLGIHENNPTANLHIKAIGSGNTTYSIKVDSSTSVPIFYVRDDGTTIVSQSLKAGNTTANVHQITGSMRISGSFRLKNGSQGTGKLLLSDSNGTGTWSNKLTGSFDISGSFYAQNIRNGGSYSSPIITKTGDYPIVKKDDMILGDATSAQITQTLPLTHTVPTGSEFTILKIDNSVNKVVVAGNGKNINGVANYDLTAQWDGITVKTNGMHWYIK